MSRPVRKQSSLYRSLWLSLVVLGSTGLLSTSGIEGNQVALSPEIAPPPRPDPVAPWIDQEGSFDYAAALNAVLGRGVTPQNNAAVLIWQAIGPTPARGNPLPVEFFQYLGIPRPVASHEDFINSDRYFSEVLRLPEKAVQQLQEQLHLLMSLPWKEREAPELAAWLNRNEKALELIRRATERPHYFTPAYRLNDDGTTISLFNNLFPQGLAMRDVIRALDLRAMRKLGDGDVAGAWQDLLTTYRLCRLLKRGTSIEVIIGAAGERITFRTAKAFLEHASLTPRQLAQCLEQLRQLPESPSFFAHVMLCEMAGILDYIQHKAPKNYVEAIGGIREFFASPPPPLPRRLEDLPITQEGWINLQREIITHHLRWSDYFRQHRASRYDPQALEALDPSPQAVEELRRQIEHEINMGRNKDGSDADQVVRLQLLASRYTAWVIVSDTKKYLPHWDEIYWHCRQCMELLQVAFALELYRCEQGRYPEKLSQLADKYLSEVPPDRFRDHPLLYHVSPEFVLVYSVGRNGRDDAARSRLDDPNNDPGADDIVIRLRPRLKH